MDNADDVGRDDSDVDFEFTDDEDGFMMMTHAVTMSQKIAAKFVTSKVSFTRSMFNMLGDRLRNVPKNYQFHSPFDSKGRRPDVPLTKALSLMKKIKKDSWLHRYEDEMLQHQLFTTCCIFHHNTNLNKCLHANYKCIT
jgi:hypothetical protein